MSNSINGQPGPCKNLPWLLFSKIAEPCANKGLILSDLRGSYCVVDH